ncbi:MAG: ATP-binding cassette domain-containing protein [Bacteroidota bacterium]
MEQTREIIRLDQVGVSFGNHEVLHNVGFRVRMGEFVYLVGRTGSGKSTLLKLLYADCQADTGWVRLGNYDIDRIQDDQIPMLRRQLGIVFQDFQLLPDRNVYQNIRFALRATGWRDRVKIKNRITEVLMKVGMSGKTKAMPHQLSGGEQQRIAIARALINDPLVLIADEPTGNLDPEASQNVLEILRRINQSGTAILMATHEYSIIRDFPSRVLQVLDKKLIDHPDPGPFLASFSRKSTLS